jgi:acetyl esterase/lipase
MLRGAMTRALLLGLALVLPAFARSGFEVRRAVIYARHDGVALTGDLYLPPTPGKHPAVIAVHGGGWQAASAGLYEHWGPYLARHGFVLFAVNYRLAAEGRKAHPEAAWDVVAAVQFLRSQGEALKVDPDRLGLLGDSAGAHLAALVALAGDQAPFAGAYPADAFASASARIRACALIYGIYDLRAQWDHDRGGSPGDNITQVFLGATPDQDPRRYAEASPLDRVSARPGTAFLVAWGAADDVVDPRTQSEAFAKALKGAGAAVETLAIPGVGHYWATGPLQPGSPAAGFAPRLLDFLKRRL